MVYLAHQAVCWRWICWAQLSGLTQTSDSDQLRAGEGFKCSWKCWRILMQSTNRLEMGITSMKENTRNADKYRIRFGSSNPKVKGQGTNKSIKPYSFSIDLESEKYTAPLCQPERNLTSACRLLAFFQEQKTSFVLSRFSRLHKNYV